MTRSSLWVLAWASLALGALVCGCDQGPEWEPLRPPPPADAGPWWESCAEEEVVRAQVFEAHCADSDCHNEEDQEANLDLVSPGVGERLQQMRSVHEECEDRTLVVPGDARASFLMDKVIGNQGSCGDPMPLGHPLPSVASRCLVEWIEAMP